MMRDLERRLGASSAALVPECQPSFMMKQPSFACLRLIPKPSSSTYSTRHELFNNFRCYKPLVKGLRWTFGGGCPSPNGEHFLIRGQASLALDAALIIHTLHHKFLLLLLFRATSICIRRICGDGQGYCFKFFRRVAPRCLQR
ncbi:hypothetical protein AVEN_214111-1 [Araneus ventricosus]|uniref:Uncharacterized protein n=1 Tax=Araneus ventricosus TaxID=182803 RepID=A0A4Y2C8Q7_ARAVE|nr:hypothetical protein AVEN_214111-1 [Araneus ventricosus]